MRKEIKDALLASGCAEQQGNMLWWEIKTEEQLETFFIAARVGWSKFQPQAFDRGGQRNENNEGDLVCS